MEFYIADFSHVFCTNVKICILGLRLKSVTKILRFSHHALLFNNGYTFACLLLVSTAFYSFSRLGVTFTEKEGRICEYFWATQIFFRTFLWKYFVSQLFLLPTLKKLVNLGVEGNVLWTLHRSSMANMTDFIVQRVILMLFCFLVIVFGHWVFCHGRWAIWWFLIVIDQPHCG